MSSTDILKSAERIWAQCEIIKHRNEMILENSLRTRKLSFLLEQDEKAIQTLVKDTNEAADLTTGTIDNMLGLFPPGQMINTRQALERAKGDIAQNRLKGGSTWDKISGMPMKNIIQAFTNVQILLGSISNAFKTVLGSLQGLGAAVRDKPEDQEKSLGALIDEYSAGDAEISGIPNRSDFEKGVKNQLQPPKGLFGNVGTGFKKAVSLFWKPGTRDIGFGLTQDDFIEDLMDMTVADVNELLGRGEEVIEAGLESGSDDPLQMLSADLERAGIDDEQLASSIEVADQDVDAAGVEISRKDLKTLKTAMDQAKTKKKSQTKALGGALNQMLGGNLFLPKIAYIRWWKQKKPGHKPIGGIG